MAIPIFAHDWYHDKVDEYSNNYHPKDDEAAPYYGDYIRGMATLQSACVIAEAINHLAKSIDDLPRTFDFYRSQNIVGG